MRVHTSWLIFLFALLLGAFLFSSVTKSSSPDIVITEIGAFEPSSHEWLEIFNRGSVPIDLSDWKFWEAGTNHGLTLSQGTDSILEPGEYAVITQDNTNFFIDYPNVANTIFDSSWGTLNESGEEIGLKDETGTFVEQFTYTSASDYSLERIDSNSLDYSGSNWKEHPDSSTVGNQNYWHLWTPPANTAPNAIISMPSFAETNEMITMDGSLSADTDGFIVSHSWDFGDGGTANTQATNYAYTSTGTYSINLIVTDDGGASGSVSTTISIIDPAPAPTTTPVFLAINEFLPNPSTGTEWIELYNPSTNTINITDWILEDGVGHIASLVSSIDPNKFLSIELSSSKLNNSGDSIILKDKSGNTIDTVSYGSWDDGNISDNVDIPDTGNSIARRIDGTDTDVDSADFAETTEPSKGLPNTITAPATDPPPSPPGGGGGGGSTPPKSYSSGDIVINELVSDPSDDGEEFIELYNTTGGTITLESWKLEDGGESQTMLEGSIGPWSFYIIEKPKGNLNNSGDSITLSDGSENEIDRVTYGSWDDGNTSDNAPAAEDPLSLARKTDGQDSNNDYYDFALTATVTKGEPNIITEVSENGDIIQPLTNTNITLNEVFPNPKGSDNESEFIEIKNIGTETVSLTGWKLGDASTKRYIIAEQNIKPGEIIIFERKQTGIALNNSGSEEVKILSPNGSTIDSISYSGSASEGSSFARREDNTWDWTTKTTPGEENILEGKSAAPVVAIDARSEGIIDEPLIFDASDTTDPEGRDLEFIWNFGDNREAKGNVVKHAFYTEGIFTVSLSVKNSNGDTSTGNIVVTITKDSTENSHETALIRISEFMPNPTGSDETEFIELFNPTEEDTDISGLKLDDEEGGSKAYTFPEGTILPARGYRVFNKNETGLALNNTTDATRLLYPDGTVLQEVRYDDVLEGASYVQNEEEIWLWTGNPTPGSENILSVPKAIAGIKISKSKKDEKPTINTTVAGAHFEDIGDKVKVRGIVLVEPGILGSQFFYITDPGSSTTSMPGIQVYMYKKDFPPLHIGDRIEITGEISESGGETRIKLSEKENISRIDHPGEPEPPLVQIEDTLDMTPGSFISVQGEITEVKSSHVYIDDGTEEIKIYFKTGAGIDKKAIQLGDLAQITGILSRTKTELRLLPRSQGDIIKTGVSESATDYRELQEQDKSAEVAEKYLTATAGGLSSILIGLFMKTRVGGVRRKFAKWFGKTKKHSGE
ncbi:MAG: lamin tail domain-containing protein [Candidatus Magasanikbacteria bacterium]